MKKWMVPVLALAIAAFGFTVLAPAGRAQEQAALPAWGQVEGKPGGAGETREAGEKTAVLAQTQSRESREQAQRKETALFMHIGSPLAVADGKLLSLDQDNPHLTPVIYQTRALVPLRVIGEYFGAEVHYDPGLARATVDTGSHTAVFPIGENYYILDGEEKALDVGSVLISGRAFVPLREICQETLNYMVDYRDDLIYIAPSAKLTEDVIRGVKSKIGVYVRASGLDALNQYMNGNARYPYIGIDDVFNAVEESGKPMTGDMPIAVPTDGAGSPAGSASVSPSRDSAAALPPAEPSANLGTDSAGGGYSSTNVQVEGVDEGDIIKTDGMYIYVISGNALKIIEAESMRPAGEYDLGDNAAAQEMYIEKGRVVVVGSRWPDSRASVPMNASGADVMISPPYRGDTNYTFIRVLDTGNMSAIRPFRYYEVEGSLITSRKKGGFVYLVSDFSRWYRGGGIDFRPLAGENGSLDPMPVENIMIMPWGNAGSFLTVSAVDIRNANEKVASETIAGSGYVTYMSSDNLYVAVYDGRFSDKETMNIARFSLDGVKIGYAGSGSIAGSINNQFSMDEWGGSLRVAATVNWPRLYNNLYIIDGNMDLQGQIQGYAEGERIYSARFIGERAYVVTFRQVDPLFVFDLKDPAAPKITGELKVPGFSTYLHPVAPDVILGVGRDVYDIFRIDSKGEQVVVRQETGGLKISLFDVSDMGKPKEIDTLILGDYGESPLLYNHKAAMFKQDDGLLGFCGYMSEGQGNRTFQGAFLISYAGGKLTEKGRLAYENPYAEYNNEAELLYTDQRLAYIGDTIYYLQDGLLRSFDLSTQTPKASLKLTQIKR